MKYFLCMDFIVTRIHCVAYKDVFHFSKWKHICSFRVNCNKCLTYVPVQKSICMLMRPFNHPENKGNTSLYPSLSHTIVLIIFIKIITEYNDQSLCFSFSRFHCANGDLSMTSHCMTSRCSVLSLLRLCEKDCSINMLNFNKLRFIVYEIFDNSQLFLTDPHKCVFQAVKVLKLNTSIYMTVRFFPYGESTEEGWYTQNVYIIFVT